MPINQRIKRALLLDEAEAVFGALDFSDYSNAELNQLICERLNVWEEAAFSH